MKGSIDIGSNSILLLIIDSEGKVVANESHVTGLGRGLDETGKFAEVAMNESKEVFRKYHEQCHEIGINPADVIVTATEASRVAKNSPDFFQEIENEFAFQVVVITGEAEAYYSTMGVLCDPNIKEEEIITIMDIGGASTELIQVSVPNKEIRTSFSMPVGAVRMNNWFEKGERDQNLGRVLKDFSGNLKKVHNKTIHCVAGTMTSVGNMFLNHSSFQEDAIHGMVISLQEIKKMRRDYAGYGPDDFLDKFPFLGKRSKTIMSGLILAETVLEHLSCEQVYISTYGLRYGTLNSGGIDHGFVFKS